MKSKKETTYNKYDTNLLQQARELLNKVYELNYDNSKPTKRLETIISKLENLITEFGEKK